METSTTPQQLHIKKGSRIFKIRSYIDHRNKPIATVECIEVWDDYSGDENSCLYENSEDNQWATFYLTSDDIDAAIEKMQEVKRFLNGS